MAAMEPGDTLELTMERISAGGDGLAFHEGKAVFVPFTAPGDRVAARVTQVRPDFLRAEPVSVPGPSPERVEPACAAYGTCGGCNLMHLGYPAQLAAREGIIREALRRQGGLEGVPLSMVPSLPFGYRNRARFRFTPDGRPGYSLRRSSRTLAVATCPILADPLRAWLESAASGDATWKALKPGKAGTDGITAFGAEGRAWVEGTDGELCVTVLDRPIRFHIGGFFQSNLAALSLLVPEVTSGLSGRRVADLYCGVGLFGAFLKDSFERVVCVEQDPRAVSHAFGNVGKPADFAASSMEEWTAGAQARQRFDHVLLDPPRAGLAPAVRAWLASSRPESIGYVSCEPVSLARDAGELRAAGYDLERVTGFDFYPQTAHVEAYARFRLR